MNQRPPVRVRFRYNLETGEVEEFIIDDNAPEQSEAYHDGVAEILAGRLGRRLEIQNAGAIRLNRETAVQRLSEEKKPDEKQERKGSLES